jgi:hypothetical protein
MRFAREDEKPGFLGKISLIRQISMTFKKEDLHGNAPDIAGVALLLIDLINDLEFSEGEQMFDRALP